MKHDDQTADRNSPEVEKREEDLFFSPTIKESVRSPAKLRAIVVNRNRFGFLVRKFTPFQWIRTKQGSFQAPRLAISKKTAARVGGKHASLARFAKRWRITQITTAFPLLRIREEGEGGGSASTGLAATSTGHVATEEETEVCATVAEETAAKLETRRFAGFQNFGCWDFEDRGGGRRFATRSEFWKDKGGVEGRGEVSAIVWRLINLG